MHSPQSTAACLLEPGPVYGSACLGVALPNGTGIKNSAGREAGKRERKEKGRCERERKTKNEL